MRKLLLICFAFWAVFQNTAAIYGTTIFNTPVQFTSGASLQITSGVLLSGTWEFTTGTTITFDSGTTITGLTLPVTLTGNVTGTGTGTVSTTVATIPDGVSEPGAILFTNEAAPLAPSSGLLKGYSNSTDKRFHDVNDAGTTGTTVVSNTGVANQFVTGIGTNGVVTLAQPTGGNLTANSVTNTQLATMAANTVKGNATGGTAAPADVSPATARSSALLNIESRTPIGDANYTVLSTDRYVVTTVTLTTTRTWTLPAANSVNPNYQVTLCDLFGAINGLNGINITRAGSDTIGPGSSTTVTLSTAYAFVTLASDGISRWYQVDSGGGLGVTASIEQFNGKTVVWTPYAMPSATPPQSYELAGNASGNFISKAAYLTNASTSQQTGFSADTYLAGSTITVNAGDFTVGTAYRCIFDMTKTAAGTIAPIISIRVGTTGTTSDTQVQTITFGAGTAAADTGQFEVVVSFNAVGASAKVASIGTCSHNLAATGLVSTGAAGVGVISNATSSSFNSTSATKIGLSFNGGTSFAGTCNVVHAYYGEP